MDCKVVIIGDGEFDDVDFLHVITDFGWHYVVRTSKNALLRQNNKQVRLPGKLKENECQHLMNVEFTREHYGPVMVLAWRMKDEIKPVYLISNCKNPLEVKQYYKHRQKIETLFSDLKTKGFNLHKSHISDLKRLGNLMIAACIAYIWLVLLGEHALNTGANKIFHRTERCDLSLLQLGFRFIEHMLTNGSRIPKMNMLGLE